MKASGAALVVDALEKEGVRFLFGIPGTHNIELYDELAKSKKLKPVLITDEQSSGFMADGVARSTGGMAVVNVVPGAGLTHALSGIAECHLDQIPVLVLTCGIRRDTGHAFQLHDIDQLAIARPVSKAVFLPKTHSEIQPMIHEACRIAREAPCGPTVVEIPANLYILPGDAGGSAEEHFVTAHNAALSFERLEETIGLLNSSSSIALYLGMGALGATARLVELADRLDAIVFTTISGKGVFPENHPRWGWNTMGQCAPPQIRDLLGELDCLLAIGCRFGEVATGSYGFDMPERLIHVDIDPSSLDRNYEGLGVTSDAKAFVDALLDSRTLRRREANAQRLSKLAKAEGEIVREQAAPSKQVGMVTPHELLTGIQRICGPDTVFVTDSGNGTFLAMENLRLTRPLSFLAPVDFSCMGYCVPAAIGAKIAAPERPVAAIAGDGAFLMTGLELLTAREQKAGVMVFIMRDRELGQISQFQRKALNRKTLTDLPEYQVSSLAEGLGIRYRSIGTKDEIDAVVQSALMDSKEGKPTLIEVAIDYSEPTHFTRGVLKTNFDRFSLKDKLRLASRVALRKTGLN